MAKILDWLNLVRRQLTNWQMANWQLTKRRGVMSVPKLGLPWFILSISFHSRSALELTRVCIQNHIHLSNWKEAISSKKSTNFCSESWEMKFYLFKSETFINVTIQKKIFWKMLPGARIIKLFCSVILSLVFCTRENFLRFVRVVVVAHQTTDWVDSGSNLHRDLVFS